MTVSFGNLLIINIVCLLQPQDTVVVGKTNCWKNLNKSINMIKNKGYSCYDIKLGYTLIAVSNPPI